MILVTGASGFVGRNLVKETNKNYKTIGTLRSQYNLSKYIEPHIISDIGPNTEWSNTLTNIDCVIHLAGLAHVKNNNINEFVEVNEKGTLKLAEDASISGVRRFIFISSIGVNGLSNLTPFTAFDIPNPVEKKKRNIQKNGERDIIKQKLV